MKLCSRLWITHALAAVMTLSGATQALGFFSSEPTGTETNSAMQTRGSTCASGTRGNDPAGFGVCNNAYLAGVQYDDDARTYDAYNEYGDMRFVTVCEEVTYEDSTNEEYTCFEEPEMEFTKEGTLGIKFFKFFNKKKTETVWRWVQKVRHKKARWLARLDEYCSDNGGNFDNILNWANGKFEICTSSTWCEDHFSSATMPVCNADCDQSFQNICDSDVPPDNPPDNPTCPINLDDVNFCSDYLNAGDGATYCSVDLGCTDNSTGAVDECGMIADDFFLNCSIR